MNTFQFLSIAEQVAAYLRDQILRGELVGDMPGSKRLANDLGINHKTISAATVLLERDGFLESQGPGRAWRITVPETPPLQTIRVAILNYEPDDARVHFIVDLQHRLNSAGHTSILATKTLTELKMNPARVARLVKKTPADAWIVQAASREVLEWFAEQSIPAFALFGNLGPVPLPRIAPATAPAIIAAVKRLVELGHHRIVMLSHPERVSPSPGFSEQLFLDELEACDIPISRYNLPELDASPEGLHRILDSIFQVTPATALIINDVLHFFPVQLYLARLGMMAPEQVSLICGDLDPRFDWCQPTVAHIHWNYHPLVNRVVNWVNNIATGTEDLRKSTIKAKFIDGGTVGPAPRNPIG